MSNLNHILTYHFPEGIEKSIKIDDVESLKNLKPIEFVQAAPQIFKLAACFNSVRCLDYLLSNPVITEKTKIEALSCAASAGAVEALTFLSSLFKKNSIAFKEAIIHSINKNQMQCFDFLSTKIDLGYSNSYPLYIAFFYQNFEAAKKILPFSNLAILKPDEHGSMGRFNHNILDKACPIFDEEIQRLNTQEQDKWFKLLGKKRLPLSCVTYSKKNLESILPKSQFKKTAPKL